MKRTLRHHRETKDKTGMNEKRSSLGILNTRQWLIFLKLIYNSPIKIPSGKGVHKIF